MNKKEFYENIKTCLEKNKLKRAIEVFQELMKQFEYYGFSHLATTYMQRYNQNENDANLGLITHEWKNVNRNRLTKALLETTAAIIKVDWTNSSIEDMKTWLDTRLLTIEEGFIITSNYERLISGNRVSQITTGNLIGEGQKQSLHNHQGIKTITEEKSELVEEYEEQFKETVEFIRASQYQAAIEGLLKIQKKLENKEEDAPKLMNSIFTNLGICYERIGKPVEETARCFIEALKYKKDDARAKFLAYLGFKLLNKENKASILYKNIKKEHPNSLEYYLLRIKENEEKIEILLENLPLEYLGDIEINYAIAQIYLNDEDYPKYKQFMNDAICLCELNQKIILKLSLSYHLSCKKTQKIHSVNPTYLIPSERERLEESLIIYKDVWNNLLPKDVRKLFLHLPVNIGAVYLALGDFKNALKWMEIALSIDKDNSEAIRGKVIALKKLRSHKKILKYVPATHFGFSNEALHDSWMIYIEVLFNSKGKKVQKKAIKLLKDFIQTCPESIQIKSAQQFLILAYLQMNEFKKAAKLSKKLDDYFAKIMIANILIEQNKKNKAVLILNKLLSKINEIKEEQDIIQLALAYEGIENFEAAISIYEKIVLPDKLNPITFNLLFCYQRIGRLDLCLDFYQRSYSIVGIHRILSFNAIQLYVYVFDYSKALELLTEYCKEFPGEIEARLIFGHLLLKTGKKDVFLEQKFDLIDVKLLNLSEGFRLCKMLVHVNLFEAALSIIYHLRQSNYESAQAHEQYILICNSVSLKGVRFEYSTISIDCNVLLKLEDGNSVNYILEDFNYRRNNLTSKDSKTDIYRKLIGKKNGDKIIWNNKKQDNYAEIVKITSKHTYFLKESEDLLLTRLSKDSSELLEIVNDVEQIKLKFIKEEESNKQFSKFTKQVHDNYRKYIFPLGAVASTQNVSPIKKWYEFIQTKNIGINCRFPEEKAWVDARNILENKNENIKFCCDLTALLAMYNLDLGEYFFKKYGKLYITQSSIDEVKNLHLKENIAINVDSSSIFYENGIGYRIKDPKEYKQKRADILKKLLLYVEKYFHTPLPVYKKLTLKQGVYDEGIYNFGKSFYDTLLIVKDSEYILLSDDAAFRAVGKNTHSIDSLSTYEVVLFDYLEKKESENFERILAGYLNLNYNNAMFNPEILVEFIKVSSNNFNFLFNKLNTNLNSQMFNGVFSWLHFLNRLLETDISSKEKASIMDTILHYYYLKIGLTLLGYSINLFSNEIGFSLMLKRELQIWFDQRQLN